MKKNFLLTMSAALLLYSCSTSGIGETGGPSPTDDNPVGGNEWSIPIGDVLDGGPGKDGIPALVNPTFIDANEASIMDDDDLVLAFKNGDDVRAYPHLILDWHEIINDNIGDVSVAITFCPLTGTGIGWGRMINNTESTFGVSGLLFNTNLIPYDRLTDSNWSQILSESVNGELIGEKPELYQVLETDWKTLTTMYPNTKVVSTITGFSRTYGVSPYGDYNTNNDRFLFPVAKDNRLPLKERVMAIIDGDKAKAYRFVDFGQKNIFRDTFEGKEYILIGNSSFLVAYELDDNTTQLQFDYVFDSNSQGNGVVLQDDEGNQWNVFGEAIDGPRSGQRLGRAKVMMGQWFSIPAFYTTELYSN